MSLARRHAALLTVAATVLAAALVLWPRSGASAPTASTGADPSHQRGMTVLMVTHDNRVFGLADRTLEMEDGRIVRRRQGDAPHEHAPVPKAGAGRPLEYTQ
jgi:hypothetical protein